jgi:lysophospholipase L1-like esterase
MMRESLKFDFGPAGQTEEGYVKVTASDAYHSERGYGFTDCSQITERMREEQTGLGRDFCIPFGTSFVVDVENGNYLVAVLIGDALAPTCTTLKTNRERLILHKRCTAAGQFVKEMFAVNVREGQLRLSFSGVTPRVNAVEITPSPQHLTVFLAGDSTMTDPSADGYPQSGWGQMLSYYLKHDVAVANHARGGRSSKSFIDEGRLDAILKEIKPNDYLFIQFGHNDEKHDAERFTDPASTYPEYLRRYIDGARDRQAMPVLITSVHRRYFRADGKLEDTHGAYLEAVRSLAEAEQVPLIDLAELSRQLFEELGPEGTKTLFLWGGPGEWMNYSGGVQDNTHFQEQGSLRIAGLVSGAIRELGLWPLAMYLK